MSYQHNMLTFTDSNLWRQCIDKEAEFRRDHNVLKNSDFYKRAHSMAFGQGKYKPINR